MKIAMEATIMGFIGSRVTILVIMQAVGLLLLLGRSSGVQNSGNCPISP